jgi:hypothetical protein
MDAESEDLSQGRDGSPDSEAIVNRNTDAPTLSSEDHTNAPIVAWESAARILADIEPIPAAGAAGVLIIIVLSVFGRLGSLIVGVLAGLLLHASLERRRESSTPWQELSRYPSNTDVAAREVCFTSHVSKVRNHPQKSFLQRQI